MRYKLKFIEVECLSELLGWEDGTEIWTFTFKKDWVIKLKINKINFWAFDSLSEHYYNNIINLENYLP